MASYDLVTREVLHKVQKEGGMNTVGFSLAGVGGGL